MVGYTSAPSSGATPLKKLLMLLMAAALCLGLAPIAPAWADEPASDAPAPQADENLEQENAASADAIFPQSKKKAGASQGQADQPRAKVTPSAVTLAPTTVDGRLSIPDPLAAAKFSVALTVVDATDGGKIVYNGAVEGMAPGSTVLDMLKAAGFVEAADLGATAANDRSFFLSYDSPYFLGKGFNDVTGDFWTTMFDGSSDNWADAMASAKLKMGGHYQYVYGTETTFEYGIQGSASIDPEPEGPTYATCKYDATKAESLQKNLAARFAKGGADAGIDNTTAFAAIALNDLGLGASLDASAILAGLASFEEDDGAPIRAGALAKYILALTAAGVDCTSVLIDGAQRNLVAEMESLIEEGQISVYDAAMILPVYGSAGYKQGSCKMSIQDLVDYVVASQQSNGLFTVSSPDSQTAAQVILALLPYRSQPAVSSAIDKAVATVRSMQLPDGSFAYNPGDNAGNLDATANLVVAFAALGIDPLSLVVENGSSPLGYAISLADQDLSGYQKALDEDIIGNETMSSATVLLALAANQGYQRSGKAYDAYAFNKVTAPEDPEQPAEQPGDQPKAEQPTTTAKGTPLAPTGDGDAAGAVATMALAAAAACMVAVRRRKVA